MKLLNGNIAPESGVTPYSLNTPLFSDYAITRRTVWMPSGVSASYDATNVLYGVCKHPVAAGPGGGGRPVDIFPGNPTLSIIPFRLNSTEPSIAMPQIGRSAVDVQGLQLVTDWISSLTGTCGT